MKPPMPRQDKDNADKVQIPDENLMLGSELITARQAQISKCNYMMHTLIEEDTIADNNQGNTRQEQNRL